MKYEDLTRKIIGCAMEVHRHLGNGFQEVVVFTKIPKNSIKIPIAGGMSYSPDFAYVLKYKDNSKTLHFVVETKNLKGNTQLRQEEIHKIKHAEKFFEGKVKIEFKTQFSNDKVVDLIKGIIE